MPQFRAAALTLLKISISHPRRHSRRHNRDLASQARNLTPLQHISMGIPPSPIPAAKLADVILTVVLTQYFPHASKSPRPARCKPL